MVVTQWVFMNSDIQKVFQKKPANNMLLKTQLPSHAAQFKIAKTAHHLSILLIQNKIVGHNKILLDGMYHNMVMLEVLIT